MDKVERIEVSQFIVKEFQVSEALKALRTNLMFSGEDIRAVGITSYSASEGKTTISFQLAAALAQAGKRVLLLDTDMRKSVLQSRFRIKGRIEGLSHYLSGMANANDLLIKTDVHGLYVMFAGVRVPNSAELLGGERFKRLIPALKDVFDYIIVDAAPIGQVIDCAVIAPELDGVAIVVDTTRNSYKLERRIRSQLEKSGGKILGVILNRVDYNDKHGYYGKAYSYKYGYGDYGQNG